MEESGGCVGVCRRGAYHVMAGIAGVLVLELVGQGTVGPRVVASLPARRPPLHHQDGQRREHLPRVPGPMTPNLLNTTRPHLPVKENVTLPLDSYNQSITQNEAIREKLCDRCCHGSGFKVRTSIVPFKSTFTNVAIVLFFT